MNKLKKALTRKLGPLPAYGWLAILAVALYWYESRKSSSSTSTLSNVPATPDQLAPVYGSAPGPSAAGDAGAGGTGDTTGSAATPVVYDPTTDTYNPPTSGAGGGTSAPPTDSTTPTGSPPKQTVSSIVTPGGELRGHKKVKRPRVHVSKPKKKAKSLRPHPRVDGTKPRAQHAPVKTALHRSQRAAPPRSRTQAAAPHHAGHVAAHHAATHAAQHAAAHAAAHPAPHPVAPHALVPAPRATPTPASRPRAAVHPPPQVHRRGRQ